MHRVRHPCWRVLALLTLSVAGISAPTTSIPGPELAELVLAGRLRPIERAAAASVEGERLYQPVRMTLGEFPLIMKIASTGGEGKPMVRVTTLVEPRDSEWHDQDGVMWLVLRYLDDADRPVSSASFDRRGNTPGWTGFPQGSRFNWAAEYAVVPDRAQKVQLLFVSGGTPRTTGFWAVRQLHVSGAGAGGEAFVPLYSLDALEGRHLESPHGTPENWVRDGTNLDTPRIFTPDGDPRRAMLCLVDADPINTGGWLAHSSEVFAVSPGMLLRIESEQMHSVGHGAETSIAVRTLPAGEYVFRARATDEYGRPTGPSLRVPVHVLPPFFEAAWFYWSAGGLTVTLMLGGVRYVTWRKLQRELQRLERQRAIEQERTRLARDIHDEMGSRLTQILLLAGRAFQDVRGTSSAEDTIRKIEGATRDLTTALDEIVWAANPKMDTLEGFGSYLSGYAGTASGNAGLRCRLEIPAILPPHPMSSVIRHRLMMAVKEAIANALKHAGASEIRVKLALAEEKLQIAVEDNGKGFDPAHARCGHGLENLRRRLEEMNGTCTIDSQLGKGTHVTFCVHLTQMEAVA